MTSGFTYSGSGYSSQLQLRASVSTSEDYTDKTKTLNLANDAALLAEHTRLPQRLTNLQIT